MLLSDRFRMSDAAPCFSLIHIWLPGNIFCTELILWNGYERSSTMIDGMFRHYHIEENRVFKANTGILNTAMSVWADDLFAVKFTCWKGIGPAREITITDSGQHGRMIMKVCLLYFLVQICASENQKHFAAIRADVYSTIRLIILG